MFSQDTLIQASPWKDYNTANTNYAFDPYGETEEKNGGIANGKEKSRNRMSNSQQTTLQMSHSPNSKPQPQSQYYYDGGNNNNNHRSSRHVDNQEIYYTNGKYNPEQNSSHYARSGTNYADRAYSLPRTSLHQQYAQASMQPAGYYTQDRRSKKESGNEPKRSSKDKSRDREAPMRERSEYSRSQSTSTAGGIDTPDFYFMPSQRKYSGEVVRVYVDYNKDPKH